MITPADLRNPRALSGYAHVPVHPYSGKFSARLERKHPTRQGSQRIWSGPWRDTAREAAQDYCDYVNNGGAVSSTPKLKSAGHKRSTPATRKPRSKRQKRISELRAELRRLEATERKGRPGRVYLIGELYKTAFEQRDPSRINIINYAVKIGHTTDERIAGLQTGNPRNLVLLAERPGTKADEKALHAKYIGDNVLHEWFRPTLAVLLEFGLRATVRGHDHLLVEGVTIQND